MTTKQDRRSFLKAAVTGMAGALASGATAAKSSETLVTGFYKTLTREQKNIICFPFDDPLRKKVDNNWRITTARLRHFSDDQQEMIKQIFLGLHSEEYAEKVYRQVRHDAGRSGFGNCSLAIFGTPGSGKFEFVFTGRHVTRRCDGDSVKGAAFGGPIFYGHSALDFNEEPHHPENIYWYQAKKANEVFNALDGKQRALALLGDPRGERGTSTVALTGKTEGLDGIPMTELSRDQKNLVREVLGDILAPYRKVDSTEAMKLIDKNGFDNLHMAFYKNMDVGDDGVWDVWQIEGPSMISYFRGDPHVHAWLNIKA